MQRFCGPVTDYPLNSCLRILDVGCGAGGFSCLAKKNTNYVCGLEISKNNSDIASQRIDQVITQDTESTWMVEEHTFDVVIMNAYLEHVFDYNFQINEVRRVLKHRGYLIIMSPNSGSYIDRLNLFAGRTPRCYLNYEHIRQFTIPMMRNILNNNGFLSTWVSGTINNIGFFNKVFPAAEYCFVIKAVPIIS